MIPKLYDHQKRIIDENKLWTGLFLGTGSAKTRTALEMAEAPILVICPKQQREDQTWQKNAMKFGIKKKMDVISKEDLRRDWQELDAYKTVIVDECHYMLGISPEIRQRNRVEIPKTSQLFEALYSYIQKHPPKRFYLCSATPVSKPFNLFAIGVLLGGW